VGVWAARWPQMQRTLWVCVAEGVLGVENTYVVQSGGKWCSECVGWLRCLGRLRVMRELSGGRA